MISLACRSPPRGRSTSVKQGYREGAPAKARHAGKACREAHRWRLQHEGRARNAARHVQNISPEQTTQAGKQLPVMLGVLSALCAAAGRAQALHVMLIAISSQIEGRAAPWSMYYSVL